MHSCLYEGHIRHRRYLPKHNNFRYRIFMAYLDLAEIDQLLPESRLWSTKQRAIYRYCRDDYFGPATVSLDDAIRTAVEDKTGRRPEGSVRMLTHVRQLGYLFNPVTFYYCWDRDDRHVETIIADITNTPWKQRYAYVLTPDSDRPVGTWHRWEMPKRFHVSPFMHMDHRYDWRFTEPGKQLEVFFQNYVGEELYFDASLSLERRPLTQRALAANLVRYPLMTAKVIGTIYWQALRLFLKGVPFHSHPKHPNQTAPERVQ